MSKLGDYVKEKRVSRGLSLRKFAELCGLSHTYLDSIEKGIDPRNGEEVRPTADTITKLAKGLGVEPSFLFNMTVGEKPTEQSVDTMTDEDVILLASKRLGYGDELTEFELEKVKLAIQIALTKNNKVKE